MITININRKPHLVPTNWDEIRFSQYEAIISMTQDNDSEPKILAGLIGVDYEVLRNADLKGFDVAMAALSFLQIAPDWTNTSPRRVGQWDLPQDITIETVAQYEEMKDIWNSCQGKHISELVKRYPDIVAIFLQKVEGGNYDSTRNAEIAQNLHKCSAREVVEAANFFISKLLIMMHGTPKIYHPPTLTMKVRKFLRKYLRRLGFLRY